MSASLTKQISDAMFLRLSPSQNPGSDARVSPARWRNLFKKYPIWLITRNHLHYWLMVSIPDSWLRLILKKSYSSPVRGSRFQDYAKPWRLIFVSSLFNRTCEKDACVQNAKIVISFCVISSIQCALSSYGKLFYRYFFFFFFHVSLR